jgi:Kef-type K+ transport system membrane component KefB
MRADLIYIVLLFCLLVAPKLLQRFRIPAAITSLVFGIVASQIDLFEHDPTVILLATLGIVTLFLFAGLEVDAHDLRRGLRILVQHLALQSVVLALVTALLRAVLGLQTRAAVLLALALFTPSTGFILDSLDSFGLTDEERFWTKAKAIATELLALVVMFFALQSTSAKQLALSSAALLGLVIGIPLALQLLATKVVPHAPKSEFAFLIMVAVVCAYATKRLGVYYLVGAFLVGVAAQRFRERLPALSSERMLHAIEAFASVFVPFYFFKAGLGIRLADLGPWSLLAALVIVVVCLPARVGSIVLHRRLALREPVRRSLRVATSLMPTLVFSLVLAEISREEFGLPRPLFGGLILYALVNTLVPGIALRHAALSFEPEAPAADAADSAPPDPATPASE